MLRNRIKDNLFCKSINELGASIYTSYEEIHEIVNKEDLSDVPAGKLVEIADALGTGVVDLYEEVFYKVYLTIDTDNYDFAISNKEVFKSYNHKNCIHFIVDDYNIKKYESILDSSSRFNIKYSILTFVRNDVDIWEIDENSEITEYQADLKYIVGLERKLDAYKELIDRVYSMSVNAEKIYQDSMDFDYDMFLRISNDIGYEHIDLISLGDANKYRDESSRMIRDFQNNIIKLKKIYALDKILVK